MTPEKDTKTYEFPPLTEEERERTRRILDEVARLREEMLAERGGRPFDDLQEILDEMRGRDDDDP